MLASFNVQSFNKNLFFSFKILKSSDLNFKVFIPIKYEGIIPVSESTEYLPPIKLLCST